MGLEEVKYLRQIECQSQASGSLQILCSMHNTKLLQFFAFLFILGGFVYTEKYRYV